MLLAAHTPPGMLADARTDANGAPVKTFTKDLISVGTWVTPDGQQFEVTPATLSRWVDTFEAMQADGVKVPVPEGHTDDAGKNRGYVTGMFVDGDTLKATIDLIGEDAIAMASRTEVSIFVPPSLKSGRGTVYEQPIAHVALTPVPVVNGQGGFVPIAASRGGNAHVPVLRLAEQEGSTTMNPIQQIASALGIDTSGMDDAAVLAAIMAALDGAGEQDASADSQASAEELASSLATARVTIAALRKGKGAPREPDPMVLKLSRQNRRLELDQLVASGKITPAVAKALDAAWVSESGLKFSLDPNVDALWDATLAALRSNDARQLGEVTRAQSVRLARETPGGGAVPAYDPDLVNEMRALQR